MPRDLEAGGVAFLVGVVHTDVNKTTYNSVTLSNEDVTWSETFLNSKMRGSAQAFVSLADSDTGDDDREAVPASQLDVLFALAWRRKQSAFVCPESVKSFCGTIPTRAEAPEAPENDQDSLPLLATERAYLNPNTKTGPATEEIYGATLLTFAPLY